MNRIQASNKIRLLITGRDKEERGGGGRGGLQEENLSPNCTCNYDNDDNARTKKEPKIKKKNPVSEKASDAHGLIRGIMEVTKACLFYC